MFILQYVAPYTGRLIQQRFKKREDAQRFAEFYRSCGTRATVIG